MFQRSAILTITMLLLTAYLISGRTQAASSTTDDDPLSPQPFMLTDLNQIPQGSDPYYFTVIGEVVYFSAADTYGRELWRSDGTANGTYRLKDIYPGEASSTPDQFTVIGDVLYFRASDGVHGQGVSAEEVWRSDGTAAGTVLVKDLPNTAWGYSFPDELTALNGILYFTYGGSDGRSLWRSDGTAAGTVPVLDAGPGSSISNPEGLTAYDGFLYFSAEDDVHDRELWRSDGTAAGTTRFKDIWPGGEKSSFPHSFTEAGGVLYFIANDEAHGSALWRSSGTAATTTLVKDIAPSQNYYSILPEQLVAMQDMLFFTADDEVHGFELWRSDGTAAGTVLVKDIFPGLASSEASRLVPDEHAGKLYFTATDSAHGLELWRSDGTTAGTALLKDIVPGPDSSNPGSFTIIGDRGYFVANDGAHGYEIWASDGTAEGTKLFIDLIPGPESSFPAALTLFNEGLLFGADNRTVERELWWSSGRAEDTHLIHDLNPGTQASDPWSPTDLNGEIIFYADEGIENNDFELWKSDGTNAPSRITDLDLVNPTDYYFPPPFIYAQQLIFSVAYWDRLAYWRTDGTPAGTRDWYSDYPYVYINANAVLNGLLYYPIYAGYTPLETEFIGLFVSNGQESRRLDLPLTAVSWLATDGRTLYLSAYTPETGYELWKSDGTEAGTTLVKDINPGSQDGSPQSSFPHKPIILNGILYFFATNTEYGQELWRSDGSEEGTWLVKDISPTDVSLRPELLNATDQFLFFSLWEAEGGGDRLWRSDGTEEGTIQLKLFPNQYYEDIREPTSQGQFLFFVVEDGEHGAELWRSDGRVAGTRLVADIFPGATGAEPQSLTLAHNGLLYFSANEGVHGRELWQSDGTAAGTRLVADISPGSPGSHPVNMADIVLPGKAKSLVFSANDGTHGHELWLLPYLPFKASAWSYLPLIMRP